VRLVHRLSLLPVSCAFTIATFLVVDVPGHAQAAKPELAALLERAGIRGEVGPSCTGEFRIGHPGEVAVAVLDSPTAGRYLVVQADGRTHPLSEFSGKPDLSCYGVREADRLNETIARSSTLNGRVVAEWDGTAVCGFIEPAIAVCWQFAPERNGFVRIGGWTS
jgi:hypothetical protein